MMAKTNIIIPIISKIYCSPSQVVLVIRKRPHVVNGGGFVVTDCSSQRVIFKVDGCGVLGTKDELIVRDGNGDALVLIRRKGGMVEALSLQKKWKGYTFNYEGSKKLVFSLKEPKNSCLARNNAIRISTEVTKGKSNKDWDFEIKGDFSNKDCSIVDSIGNIVAHIGVKKEVEELMMASKDLYHVIVKPGIDQAFIVGVIATLDYINGESTRC